MKIMEPKLYQFEKMPFEQLNDKIKRRFVHGEKTMLAWLEMKKGAFVPEHQHENEQLSYIVKGKMRIVIGGKEFIVSAGEVVYVPPNVPHHAEFLEDTIDVDIFSPPRQDWIDKTDAYLR